MHSRTYRFKSGTIVLLTMMDGDVIITVREEPEDITNELESQAKDDAGQTSNVLWFENYVDIVRDRPEG